jgi:hypothetical protein
VTGQENTIECGKALVLPDLSEGEDISLAVPTERTVVDVFYANSECRSGLLVLKITLESPRLACNVLYEQSPYLSRQSGLEYSAMCSSPILTACLPGKLALVIGFRRVCRRAREGSYAVK